MNNKKAKVGGATLPLQTAEYGSDTATSAPLYDLANGGDAPPRKPVYE